MNHVLWSLHAWCIGSVLLLSIFNLPMIVCAQSESSSSSSHSHSTEPTTIDFEHFETGPVPKDFTPFLGGSGKESAWQIKSEPSALSGTKVLAQTSYDQIDNRFPMLVYNDVTAKNVRVAVQFKTLSGKIDQAAGIIVRFQDSEHFYVVRANALENTVQLYRVVEGVHHVVTSKNVHVEPGKWHSLNTMTDGAHVTVFFDGQQLLDVRDDTFSTAGKIGLLTKSDGVTLFDDLQVTVLDR
jgi:hypothetical protein